MLGIAALGTSVVAKAQFMVPSDVSVALSAAPNAGLAPGDEILVTLSMTNLGPELVARVLVISSDIYNEYDPYQAYVECEGLAVTIGETLPQYYNYWWYPALTLPPMQVGETRYCYLHLFLTEHAPPSVSLTFALPYFYSDLDPSNNSATVTLRRAGAAATPVPTLAFALLFLLATLLAGPALHKTRSRAKLR